MGQRRGGQGGFNQSRGDGRDATGNRGTGTGHGQLRSLRAGGIPLDSQELGTISALLRSITKWAAPTWETWGRLCTDVTLKYLRPPPCLPWMMVDNQRGKKLAHTPGKRA